MLIATEATICPLNAPYSYLWAQMLVDFGNYAWVLNDEFQRYHVAGSVDPFVSTSTSDERGLLRVICIGF